MGTLQRSLLASALLGFVTLSTTARATGPELPLSTNALDRGELKMGLGGAYLNTNANYDKSGNKLPLPGLGSFQSVQAGLFGQYGITSEWTALAEVPFVYNSVTGPATSGTQLTASNSAGGPGDARLGAHFDPWHDPQGPVRAGFDLTAGFPLYSRLLKDQWVTLTPGGPVPLGTGVTEFTLAARGALRLATDFDLTASLGFMARTGGFSDLVPYQLSLRYEEHHGLMANLGLKGAFTAGNDQFTTVTPPPTDRATGVIAQSLAYNAINPTYTALRGSLGTYLGDTFFVTVAAELPIVGRNTAAGPTYSGVLGFDFGGLTPRPVYESSNRGFQEYSLTSKVIQVNNKLRQLLIDRGSNDLVKKGELLDVFEPNDKDESYGETVARARVMAVGPTRAKLQIVEYFKEGPIQEGFVVRRPVR